MPPSRSKISREAKLPIAFAPSLDRGTIISAPLIATNIAKLKQPSERLSAFCLDQNQVAKNGMSALHLARQPSFEAALRVVNHGRLSGTLPRTPAIQPE
jgi:hypothetical protein